MIARGLDDVCEIGVGLVRPECVLCTASGDVFVSDWRGGVTRIRPDGRQQLYAAAGGDGPRPVKTNGFAILPDRSFLLAHLDDASGGVWRLTVDGHCTPYLLELDGRPLEPTNFVHVDPVGRTWITVSTRLIPRMRARRPDVADGYVVLVDGSGARIVADGLAFTNEAKVDPSGRWLYVNETFGRRVSRFEIRANGDLGPIRTVAQFDHGVFPDGLDFDRDGGVWITSVFSNRLIRIDADGNRSTVLEDFDPEFLDTVDSMLASGALATTDVAPTPARLIRNLSSSAFGGPDRRTLYLGCLQGDRIYRLPSPVAGARPSHWNVTFG